ncbi:hypothetical protein D3C76_1250350 [compost metagenome]
MLLKLTDSQDIDGKANDITLFILKGASFVFIFLVVTTIVFILQMLLNLVFNIPILSSINKIGGVGVAGIMAIFKVWVILAIVSILIQLNIFDFLNNLIQQSTLTKILYENNIIVSIISSSLKL